VETEVFLAGGRTDREKDLAKLIVVFCCYFAKALEKEAISKMMTGN